MKAKKILLTIMCTLALSTFAANEDNGVVIFHETFGTNEWHRGIANKTGELKAGSSYYFDEPVYIHADWSQGGGGYGQKWPNASGGSVLALDDDYTQFSFKINTEDYPFALFSYADGPYTWGETEAIYSFDGGVTWKSFSKYRAKVTSYDNNVNNEWTWKHYVFSENIGGQSEVIVRIVNRSPIGGTIMADDLIVLGYEEALEFMFKIEIAIAEATELLDNNDKHPAYCPDDIAALQLEIEAAQGLSSDASDKEKADAVKALFEAIDALKEKKIDISELNEAVTQIAEILAKMDPIYSMAPPAVKESINKIREYTQQYSPAAIIVAICSGASSMEEIATKLHTTLADIEALYEEIKKDTGQGDEEEDSVGTVFYTESFGTNAWHQGIANKTGELKAGSSYYFNEPVYIHADWSDEGGGYGQKWPNASGGSVLALGDNYTQFRIKLSTLGHPYAFFSYAYLYSWGVTEVSYSADGGATWTQFAEENGRVIEYGGNFLWRHVTFYENIGDREEVIIRIAYKSGTVQVDDPAVTSYGAIPLFKSYLKQALHNANAIVEENAISPAYCADDMANFMTDIAAAEAVWNNEEVFQGEFDAAEAMLNASITNLKAKKIDLSELNQAVEDAYVLVNWFLEQKQIPDDAREAFEAILSYVQSYSTADVIAEICAGIMEPIEASEAFVDSFNEAYNYYTSHISIEDVSKDGFTLYPNPAGNEIRIAGAVGKTVYIFNAAGQQVLSVSNYTGEAINISVLPPGIYTAGYAGRSETFVKK